MKNFLKFFLISSLLLTAVACKNKSAPNYLDSPFVFAIDSTNNRLLALSEARELYAFEADTQSLITKKPLIDEKTNAPFYETLPRALVGMATVDQSDSTRIFVAGDQVKDKATVTNQILIFDFDGTTLTTPDESPLVLDDGNNATDETEDAIGGLLADSSTTRLYVTDATSGLLYIFNTDDGTQVRAPVALGGVPGEMTLIDKQLFIANRETGSDGLFVMNTDNFTVSTVPVDFAVAHFSIVSTDSGFLLLASLEDEARVLVQNIDTALLVLTDVPAGDSTVVDGEINSSKGITSAVGGVLAVTDTSGVINGYVGLADGNIILLTIKKDLTSFSLTSIDTTTTIVQTPIALINSAGDVSDVFLPAVGTDDLLFAPIGSLKFNIVF